MEPIPGSALWWRAQQQRPRRASHLTAQRIVVTALRIADTDGLDALTMRRLADELDTGPASLYRHFENRDALLIAVVDHAIGELPDTIPPGDTWPERIANVARAMRALLLRHPALPVLWRSTEQLGPNGLRTREHALQLALASGVTPKDAATGYLAILHFVVGFTILETGPNFRTPAQLVANAQYFRDLPPDEFPAIVTLADELTRPNADEEFEFGLQAMIAGIWGAVGATLDPNAR